MRRILGHYLLMWVLGTLALVSVAAIAVGATPVPSARYSGSGKLCQNNAPKHRFASCLGHDRFSLHTSANGKNVIKFKGKIGPIYCGGASFSITVKRMKIKANGSFAFSFSRPNSAFGKVNGVNHAKVRGRFIGNGKQVKIFYRLLTHFNNTPHSADCGAQVSGTGST